MYTSLFNNGVAWGDDVYLELYSDYELTSVRNANQFCTLLASRTIVLSIFFYIMKIKVDDGILNFDFVNLLLIFYSKNRSYNILIGSFV